MRIMRNVVRTHVAAATLCVEICAGFDNFAFFVNRLSMRQLRNRANRGGFFERLVPWLLRKARGAHTRRCSAVNCGLDGRVTLAKSLANDMVGVAEPVLRRSASVTSGAVASGAVASGAVASGAVASGAVASASFLD